MHITYVHSSVSFSTCRSTCVSSTCVNVLACVMLWLQDDAGYDHDTTAATGDDERPLCYSTCFAYVTLPYKSL